MNKIEILQSIFVKVEEFWLVGFGANKNWRYYSWGDVNRYFLIDWRSFLILYDYLERRTYRLWSQYFLTWIPPTHPCREKRVEYRFIWYDWLPIGVPNFLEQYVLPEWNSREVVYHRKWYLMEHFDDNLERVGVRPSLNHWYFWKECYP